MQCAFYYCDKYLVFELNRKNKEGGGIAIGCEKSLKPAWVREGDDDAEALSIDIFVKGMKIRCCAAYGCQEGDQVERKKKFWNDLNEEVQFAQNSLHSLLFTYTALSEFPFVGYFSKMKRDFN